MGKKEDDDKKRDELVRDLNRERFGTGKDLGREKKK